MGISSTSLGLTITAILMRSPPSPAIADILFAALALCTVVAIMSFLATADQ